MEVFLECQSRMLINMVFQQKYHNTIFSWMNIIFFSDAGNVTFKCIFCGRRLSFLFWQKGNILFITFIHIYRKYHISMIFFLFFLRKIIFHCPCKEKIYFWEKRNTIFPDITKKVIFQGNFFGKTIFSENLKKTYFHAFFWERSSFLFCLKNDHIPVQDHLFRTLGKRKHGFSCTDGTNY